MQQSPPCIYRNNRAARQAIAKIIGTRLGTYSLTRKRVSWVLSDDNESESAWMAHELQQGAAANIASERRAVTEERKTEHTNSASNADNKGKQPDNRRTRVRQQRPVLQCEQGPVRTGARAEAPKTEKPSGPGGRAHTGSRDLPAKAPG